MVEAWTSPTDRGKVWSDSEQTDAMCMVGLERNHYERLPPGKTIDYDLYCQQLMRLKKGVEIIGRPWCSTMTTPDRT